MGEKEEEGEEEQLSLDVCLWGLDQETSFKFPNLGTWTLSENRVLEMLCLKSAPFSLLKKPLNVFEQWIHVP